MLYGNASPGSMPITIAACCIAWPPTRAFRSESATRCRAWASPGDESIDHGGWPHQLYVREARRIVKEGVVTREGKVTAGRGGAPPCPIIYGVVVPRRSECDNPLVTFALSASHVAFASIRMEPVFMITSQSAAAAAVRALDEDLAVQDVDYSKLRRRLLREGQILERAAETSR